MEASTAFGCLALLDCPATPPLGSPQELFTLFKCHTGLTPNEYLVRLRIRKAKELVKQGTTDATTIAKAVGFNDPAYFKNVYLRYTGTTFKMK